MEPEKYGLVDRGGLANRMVGRVETPAYIVSTVRNTGDSKQPYETAIQVAGRPWVVVEEYPTIELAKIGHVQWTDYATTNPLDGLVDVSTCRLKRALLDEGDDREVWDYEDPYDEEPA